MLDIRGGGGKIHQVVRASAFWWNFETFYPTFAVLTAVLFLVHPALFSNFPSPGALNVGIRPASDANLVGFRATHSPVVCVFACEIFFKRG